MQTIGYIITLLFRATFGFTLSCYVSSLIVAIAIQIHKEGMPTAELPAFAMIYMLFVGFFSIIPSALVILASEVCSYRNLSFYLVSGGVVAFLSLSFLVTNFSSSTTNITLGSLIATLILIVAGVAGGFTYWLVSGQFAGRAR